MKFVANTPDELILHESAAPFRWIGAAFVIAAGVVALFTVSGSAGHVEVVPLIVAALFTAAGLALVILPKSRTFAFGRSERMFIMARERFGRVEREMIPLRDIADVVVEESRGRNGATYRVALTLADQRRVPWTPYYSSGYGPKRRAADAARSFLGLAPGATAAAPWLPPAATVRARKGAFAAMALFCLLFLAIGITMAAKEQHRLSTYRPVVATVLSTRVEEHHDSDGSTYRPVVVYRYRVNDRSYTASRVTPLSESRSGGWARRVIDQYAVGREYTAYYDPASPREAFLLRQRSILPMLFVAIPLVGLVIVGAASRAQRGGSP